MTDKEKTELQNEIIKGLPNKPHGLLLIPPRGGKSRITIELIKRNKPKTILWVTPSAELAEVVIPEEFKIWKAAKFIPKLQTSTWASLYKVTGHFDMVILDEVHHITEHNSCNFFNHTLKSESILGITGSNTQHTDKKFLYSALNLKVLYKMDLGTAVDIGLLANYNVTVVDCELGTEKTYKAGSKDKPFLTTEFNNYLYYDKVAEEAIRTKSKDRKFKTLARRRVIINSPSKAEVVEYLWNNLEGRNMFFCSSITMADSLTKHTYHSKTDNTYLQQFINGEINKLALVNAGGTGFTYKAIDNLVVVQCDSDKNDLVLQKLCRSLLQQKGYTANIWFIRLKKTQDVVWVSSVIKKLDPNKVKYITFEELKSDGNRN